MRLDLEAMTSYVRDIDEAILIGDGDGSTRGAEFASDLFGLCGGDADGVRYGKVEREVFNIPGVILQLQLRGISKGPF